MAENCSIQNALANRENFCAPALQKGPVDGAGSGSRANRGGKADLAKAAKYSSRQHRPKSFAADGAAR